MPLQVFYLSNKYCLPELTYLCECALHSHVTVILAAPRPDSHLAFADLLPFLEAAFLVREGGVLYTTCMRAVLRCWPVFMNDADLLALQSSHGQLHAHLLGLAAQCIKIDEDAIDRLCHMTICDRRAEEQISL